MTDRDVIAEALRRWPIPDDQVDVLADAIATTLDAHHTIHTLEKCTTLPDGTAIAFFADDTGAPLDETEIYFVSDGIPDGFDEQRLDYWLSNTHIRVLFRPEEDGAR